MKLHCFAAIFAIGLSVNLPSASADNSDCGAQEEKQSADCGRESEDAVKACRSDQAAAQEANDGLAAQVKDTSGLGQYRQGKMLAGIATAGKKNWDSANQGCGRARQKLSKACGCAHYRALKREKEARAKYESARNLNEKRKYRDEMVQAARDRAMARAHDRDRGREIDSDRERIGAAAESLGQSSQKATKSSIAASAGGQGV